MVTTAADVLMDILIEWGVDTIFGLPGDGINGLMEALRTRQEKIKFIHVRHEEAAAFMACGYAKVTGKLGVCLATSGPGGIHLLNGLYDAKMDGQPVLAITGMHFHDLLDTHSQQDVDLDKLFADVAVYNTRIMSPTHVEAVADLACRTALAYRGVAHLAFPTDTQSMPVKRRDASERNIHNHASHVATSQLRAPDVGDVRRAAEILNSGKKVAILAGRGALAAGKELEEIAETLGAPIIKALLGKAAVDDESPYTTGGIGLLGTRPSQTALEECDTLFIVGTSFPYMEFYPKPGQARAVQIDLDAARIGLRYPVEIGLVGDALSSLRLMKTMLNRNENREFLEHAQKGMIEWNELMKTRATPVKADKAPLKPQFVAAEIGRRLADDAMVVCDSGTITTWWARHIRAKPTQFHTVSGNLASMACALPYAIAAQVAFPNRPCVAFIGDGGFSMLMAEFATCVQYKLPIKIVVIKNNTLGQIKWEQMVFLGNPEYGCELEPIDFAAFARACGGTGFKIENPGECSGVMDAALNTPGPVLIEATVDPFEAPMPAKINVKQAAHFAESLARGEPNREKIVLTVLADKVRELV